MRSERQFRFFRAGFTSTYGVLVSAVPSSGIGGPAPLLGGPGIEVKLLAPAGDVHRGAAVAVSGVSTGAIERAIGQCQIATDGTADRTDLARREPAIRDNQFAAAPGLFIAQLAGELGPASVGDGSGQSTVGQHPRHVQVFDDESVVGLDQRVGYLVQEMPAHVCYVAVVTPQLGGGVTAVTGSFLLAMILRVAADVPSPRPAPWAPR